jgi:hypothetical protein
MIQYHRRERGGGEDEAMSGVRAASSENLKGFRILVSERNKRGGYVRIFGDTYRYTTINACLHKGFFLYL